MAEPYRVIVIDDDPDVALYSKTVLERRGECVVLTLADGRLVSEAVREFKPDVLLTDIELPGISGLEVIALVRAIRPTLPVIVMTAHASVDYAITALRNQADEFLVKPVSSVDLIAHVSRLAESSRLIVVAPPSHRTERVLAIGAHPDDVEVGVGGILAAHRAAGDDVTILTLSRGMRDGGIQGAWTESSRSAEIIGAQLILEDGTNALADGVSQTADIIRRVIATVSPTVVYVHSKNDDNQDHRSVHEATLVASSRVRTIACYQGTGATVDFRPNRFVSIDNHTDDKLAMLACFGTDGSRPDYLTPDFALATARAWSRFGSGTYSEALEIIRDSADVL